MSNTRNQTPLPNLPTLDRTVSFSTQNRVLLSTNVGRKSKKSFWWRVYDCLCPVEQIEHSYVEFIGEGSRSSNNTDTSHSTESQGSDDDDKIIIDDQPKCSSNRRPSILKNTGTSRKGRGNSNFDPNFDPNLDLDEEFSESFEDLNVDEYSTVQRRTTKNSSNIEKRYSEMIQNPEETIYNLKKETQETKSNKSKIPSKFQIRPVNAPSLDSIIFKKIASISSMRESSFLDENEVHENDLEKKNPGNCDDFNPQQVIDVKRPDMYTIIAMEICKNFIKEQQKWFKNAQQNKNSQSTDQFGLTDQIDHDPESTQLPDATWTPEELKSLKKLLVDKMQSLSLVSGDSTKPNSNFDSNLEYSYENKAFEYLSVF